MYTGICSFLGLFSENMDEKYTTEKIFYFVDWSEDVYNASNVDYR